MANFTVSKELRRTELNETNKSWLPTDMVAFLSASNLFLSITAPLGNALILVALHKVTSLHPPTKLLLRCLAITDLCVGVITQPLYAVFLLSSVTEMNLKVIYYLTIICNASSFVLCQVSIFTSSAISVDRLLALLSGLRYRHVVTLPRVRAFIICFWLIAISCASMNLWGISEALTVAFALVLFSLTTTVFSYAKIYQKLRQYQLQVRAAPQAQANGRQVPLNIARYKKSVSSVLWVQLALVTCYIPFIIVQAILMSYGTTSRSAKYEIAFNVTLTLVYLNSSLSPTLFCWRMITVRQAAKDTIKQLNCFNSV